MFLELFAGAQGLSAALRRAGHNCMSFELKVGLEYDLSRPCTLRLIEGWISSKAVVGVWLGTPCTTWSRARRGPPGSSWAPLRANQALLGLPNLRPVDVERVQVGNATARASARIIRCCERQQCPVYLENPATSMLWISPFIAPLLRRKSCKVVNTDFCQFHKPWRKRTKLAAWHTPELATLSRLCSGKHGCCSRTGRPHRVLAGSDPISKRLWTQIAEPYPAALCTRAAQHMGNAACAHQLRKRASLVS